MMNKNIEYIINKNVKEYISRLSEKYSLDSAELEALWVETSGSDIKKKTTKSATKKDSDIESVASSKKTIEGGCPYVFSKGKDAGNACSIKPKDGKTYCSKHLKCDESGQKEKKVSPTTKKTVASVNSKPKSSPVEKKRIVIRMNKDINKYWNPETHLVFKSKEERVVIGSCTDDELKPLSDDDIATCQKYGFKYEQQEKKSLSEEIVNTNLKAEHIENVLSEICKEDGDDDDGEVEDAEEEEEGELEEEDD